MKHLQLARLRFTVEEPEAQRGCDMSIELSQEKNLNPGRLALDRLPIVLGHHSK